MATRQRWTFSFRFFKQVRYFAFEGLAAPWFAAFFERMASLGEMFLDEFKNPTLASDMRCHPIRWGDRSNFTRAYFDWIPSPYLEAEEEYPLMQFMVSTGLGRVVGFFDEADVFQIVALDPKHNIQKSRGREGKKNCQPIRSDLMDSQARIDRALAALDSDHPAAAKKARDHLCRAATGLVSQNKVWVVAELDEKDADELHQRMVSSPGVSPARVMERGLMHLLEEAERIFTDIAEETIEPDGKERVSLLDDHEQRTAELAHRDEDTEDG